MSKVFMDGADPIIIEDMQSRILDVNYEAERQGGQMSRLLDDLLDVSRVTQGKIQLRQSVCDVTRMIDDAIECLQPRIEQRQHEMNIEIRDRPLFVRGDCSRLLQIQMNLLSNAVKYTPPGGKIQVTLHRDGSQAVLRVCDNGRRIPVSMLNSIFDLFVQTDDPKHQDEGGMGVGLTLVQQLVELHGGTVKAASAGPGQGSEFVVRLPLTDQRPSIVDAAELRQPRKQLRVLIVEHRPEVALVDLHLPVLNGYEVARRARANQDCQGVRLIALTGYGGAKNHQAVLQAGFDLHLVKPISPEKLLQALTQPFN